MAMLTTIHTSRRDLTERTTRGRPTQMAAAACAVVLAFTFFGLSGIAMAKGQATVSVAKLKGIGSVLVDTKGHTLYTFVDNGQPVDCSGACLNMGFAPYTIAAGKKPTAGKGVKGLGLVSGGTQVTENGFPLFVFSTDKPHQANGQGMMGTGGTWHVPTVAASKHKSTGGSNAGTGGVSF